MHDLISVFTSWILTFGAPILFLLLVLGIVGLPIPDETLLTLSGWLMAKGKLEPYSIVIAAILGSICGITISYWLGRSTGTKLFEKFRSKLKITEGKIQKISKWYERIGKWILLIGYYIPFVRHLAGYIAGSSGLGFRKFMLYAYVGATIWSITFLCLGYFFFHGIF